MPSERLPLSAFIICKNEAAVIGNCVRTLAECGEIVVVDSGSTDGTLDVLRGLQTEGFPLRIIERPWPGFAAQKQFALEQCSLPWAINVDADERLDPEFRRALPGLLAAPESVGAWRVVRRPYLVGRGYSSPAAHEGRMLRLVRRARARYNLSLLVHEAMLIDGEVRDAASGTLLHFRTLTVDEQIRKEAGYAVLKARQLAGEGKSPRFLRMAFNPFVYFLRYYLVRRMFLCGWPGFITAANAAAYTFLCEARLWQDANARDAAEDDRRASGL